MTRLAKSKAATVGRTFPGAVIIGSDQVAVCDSVIVGKPGHAQNAIRQLRGFSGKTVRFLTAIAVICRNTGFEDEHTSVTDVCFRELADDEIKRYVALDRPFDCAGSFKSEAAGTSLLKTLNSEDPTAIIGLPLIATAAALRKAGFFVP